MKQEAKNISFKTTNDEVIKILDDAENQKKACEEGLIIRKAILEHGGLEYLLQKLERLEVEKNEFKSIVLEVALNRSNQSSVYESKPHNKENTKVKEVETKPLSLDDLDEDTLEAMRDIVSMFDSSDTDSVDLNERKNLRMPTHDFFGNELDEDTAELLAYAVSFIAR